MKNNERKILLELVEDGRKNISDIAKKLGISRQTVSKKIRGMEEKKIIDSFSVKIDEGRVGLNTKAYVILNIAPSSELRHRFVREAKKIENISQMHHTFGRFDMILEILVKDEKELDRTLDKIRDFEAVEETETLICKYMEKNDQKDPIRYALEKDF